jgi:hypothetical protein
MVTNAQKTLVQDSFVATATIADDAAPPSTRPRKPSGSPRNNADVRHFALPHLESEV